MRLRAIVWLVAAALLVRCATIPPMEMPELPSPVPEPEPLTPALERYADADYASALRMLVVDARRCAAYPVGRWAALVGAALALDPRNPEPDPDLAAELVRDMIEEGTAAWERPIAESLFLLALELGAEPPSRGPSETLASNTVEPVASAKCAEPAGLMFLPPAELPALERPSLTARIADLEARRDSLVRHAEAMSAELAEVRQELERIRRVLRPPTDTMDASVDRRR